MGICDIKRTDVMNAVGISVGNKLKGSIRLIYCLIYVWLEEQVHDYTIMSVIYFISGPAEPLNVFKPYGYLKST